MYTQRNSPVMAGVLLHESRTRTLSVFQNQFMISFIPFRLEIFRDKFKMQIFTNTFSLLPFNLVIIKN